MMNEISKLKDVNSIFGGVYLPAALTRCRLLSAFGKLLFAHLAQNADSHNLVQLNFLFSVSEMGFLDERELIETLDELESFGMILVQRGNSNSELVVAQLMPDFTEILSEREMKGRRKKRTRHSPIYNFKNSQPFRSADNIQSQPETADKTARQTQSDFGKTVGESPVTMQSELFPLESCGTQPKFVERKSNRKQPRSRHTLQDCWSFANISGNSTARREYRLPTGLRLRFIRPDNRTTRLICFCCRASSIINRKTPIKTSCINTV